MSEPAKRPTNSGGPPMPQTPAAAAVPAPPPGRPRIWVRLAVIGVLLVIAGGVGSRFVGGRGRPGEEFTLPAVAVRAELVARASLAIQSSYPGELIGEVSDLSPQVSGILAEVPVRIGDVVAQGQVVAVIDDVDLRNQLMEAKGQLGVADANRKRSQAELIGMAADHRRSDRLYQENLLSEQEFDRVVANLATAQATLAASHAQVEQAGARVALLEEQHANARLLAPFGGTVAARYLDRGVLVQPGTPILRLVEAAPLLAQFHVPERDLGAVRPGVTLSVQTQGTGARLFAGTVLRVSGEVSRNDRTVTVEAGLNESDALLRPGMYAEVVVRVQSIEDTLVVPGSAILERVAMDGTRHEGVFVVRDDTAAWVPVVVEGRSGNLAAIEAPIESGDLVLTLGHTELENGGRINVVGSAAPQQNMQESTS
ncbi:MAG: efflux RND transporter periplasmic adaptor subunit [Acidobacteriota bacterium]|nr:efflux RND transporter periplasmic adaptor subunit [Acidobacteriota bacterium]